MVGSFSWILFCRVGPPCDDDAKLKTYFHSPHLVTATLYRLFVLYVFFRIVISGKGRVGVVCLLSYGEEVYSLDIACVCSHVKPAALP